MYMTGQVSVVESQPLVVMIRYSEWPVSGLQGLQAHQSRATQGWTCGSQSSDGYQFVASSREWWSAAVTISMPSKRWSGSQRVLCEQDHKNFKLLGKIGRRSDLAPYRFGWQLIFQLFLLCSELPHSSLSSGELSASSGDFYIIFRVLYGVQYVQFYPSLVLKV